MWFSSQRLGSKTVFKFNVEIYQDLKSHKKIGNDQFMYLLFYLTGFSYIFLGNQTPKRYDDRDYMEDDVAQPVLQNLPDRMESTGGLKFIITSNRISKCLQLGFNQSP